MDTIAIETVNYFGIGSGPQTHTMNLVAPLNLPFTGFLNLYTSFYDSIACSFPIAIPDTTTGLALDFQDKGYLNLHPNPLIQFETGKLQPGISHIKIISIYGEEMINLFTHISNSKTCVINIEKLLPGAYILMLIQKNSCQTTTFIKQ